MSDSIPSDGEKPTTCPICLCPLMEDGECVRHDRDEMICWALHFRYGQEKAERELTDRKMEHIEDIGKASDTINNMRRAMASARAALLKIWPDGEKCSHQHAREAFEALR